MPGLPGIVETEGQILLEHEVLEFLVGLAAVVEAGMKEQLRAQVLAHLEVERVFPFSLHVVVGGVVEGTRAVGDGLRDAFDPKLKR